MSVTQDVGLESTNRAETSTVKETLSVLHRTYSHLLQLARVGPRHCYRIGPIRFLAGWRKRRCDWTRVSL